MSGKKKKRPRTQRREAERRARQRVQDREKLVRRERGGAPDRPIRVESAAVIEARALALGCHQCGGALGLDDHRAVVHDEQRLRVVDARCRTCGARRTIYITLAATGLN